MTRKTLLSLLFLAVIGVSTYKFANFFTSVEQQNSDKVAHLPELVDELIQKAGDLIPKIVFPDTTSATQESTYHQQADDILKLQNQVLVYLGFSDEDFVPGTETSLEEKIGAIIANDNQIQDEKDSENIPDDMVHFSNEGLVKIPTEVP